MDSKYDGLWLHTLQATFCVPAKVTLDIPGSPIASQMGLLEISRVTWQLWFCGPADSK